MQLPFALDLGTRERQGLRRSVESLADELNRPAGLASANLARRRLEDFVLCRMLAASGAPGGPRRRRLAAQTGGGGGLPGRSRAGALRPEDLARGSCISVRALQASFRRELVTTPSRLLGQLRLERVQPALSPRGHDVAVGVVALQWVSPT